MYKRENNLNLVRNHFSENNYIKEMFDRNILGLRDWEKIIVEKYFINGKKNIGHWLWYWQRSYGIG